MGLKIVLGRGSENGVLEKLEVLNCNGRAGTCGGRGRMEDKVIGGEVVELPCFF